jgi:curved DNA-binding protein CbpA
MIDEDALRIAVLADHLDEVDYYTLLEIDPAADTDTVRDAFHRFALRFHPDQHVDDPSRQRRALAIFKRGSEAYRVLAQKTLRERYDAVRVTGAKRLPHDRMQLPADESREVEMPQAARAFWESAVAAYDKGDFGGARMHLALAAARGDNPKFDELAKKIGEQLAKKKR